MSEKEKSMCAVRRTSFALVETVLYLDGHPYDTDALEYYKNIKEKYDEAVKCYEENYGPITVLGVNCEKGWTWVETPWPWEMEANA